MSSEKTLNLVLQKAELSLKFVQRHGYETILYVDEESANFLKHLPYDTVKIIKPSLLKRISPHFWSVGKIYAYSQTRKPFVHIDFDVFLFEDFVKWYNNWPFFSFAKEKWTKTLSKPFAKLIEHCVPEISNVDYLYSYNCSVFGGKDFNSINKAARKTLSVLLNHQREFIEYTEKHFLKVYKAAGVMPWYLALLLEQVIFIHILMHEQNLIEFPTITGTKDSLDDFISDFKKLKMFHLWGDELKTTIQTCFGSETFLKIIEKYFYTNCCKIQ